MWTRPPVQRPARLVGDVHDDARTDVRVPVGHADRWGHRTAHAPGAAVNEKVDDHADDDEKKIFVAEEACIVVVTSFAGQVRYSSCRMTVFPSYARVPSALDKKLAKWLRAQRGEMTFAAFSKKVGLPPSTIFRLERCEQSITLGRLDKVLGKLKCTLADVFGAGS